MHEPQRLARAQLLYQQSRYEEAEREIRQALSQQPEDAYAHALLAMCLCEREDYKAATEAVRQAIHLAPDYWFVHHVHARVLSERNRYAEALAAVREALALDSEQPANFALEASIHLANKQWRQSLAAAESGLAIDPEHAGCVNLRAMALQQLGRRGEADEAIAAALSRNPDDEMAHANHGWNALHRNDPKQALEHFREALRLDPNNDYAKAGLVEALKARNFLYRIMLAYFLFMARLSGGMQWGIILGGYIGYQVLRSVARNNPEAAPFVLPLIVLYIVFALLTWLAQPLFNLLLRFNKYGKYALKRDQKVQSNWLAGLIGLGLACAIGGITVDSGTLLVAAIYSGLMVFPVTAVFNCSAGWPRRAMSAYAAAVAVVGLAAVAMFQWTGSAGVLAIIFPLGAVLGQFVGNFLAMQVARE